MREDMLEMRDSDLTARRRHAGCRPSLADLWGTPGWFCRKRENRNVGISERKKEIQRRRHRRKKLGQLAKRLGKATVSERAVIAEKLRALTPGGGVIIQRWGLEER
jgi:Family of unknown function (DUF6800)